MLTDRHLLLRVGCDSICTEFERLLVQKPKLPCYRVAHTRSLQLSERNTPKTFPSRKSERPPPKIGIRRKQLSSFDASDVSERSTSRSPLLIDLARKQSLLARTTLWSFKEKDIIQLR
jgi:hypothetical protein